MFLTRRLWPQERGLLLDHLLRLEPEDRYARFCGALAEAPIRQTVERLSWSDTIALVRVEDGAVRAAALLVGLGTGGDAAAGAGKVRRAELGLSVERAWQGRGLGLALTRAALALARNRGAGEVMAYCLPENRRMQRIVRRLSGELAFEHGEVDGRLRLAWPDALSLWQEAAIEGEGWLERWREGVAAGRRAA